MSQVCPYLLFVVCTFILPDPDVTHDTFVCQVSVGVQDAALDQVSVPTTLCNDLLLQRDVLRCAEQEDQPRDHTAHPRPAPGASDDVTIILVSQSTVDQYNVMYRGG